MDERLKKALHALKLIVLSTEDVVEDHVTFYDIHETAKETIEEICCAG